MVCSRASCCEALTQPVLRALKKQFFSKETRPFCSLPLGILGDASGVSKGAREEIERAREEGKSK